MPSITVTFDDAMTDKQILQHVYDDVRAYGFINRGNRPSAIRMTPKNEDKLWRACHREKFTAAWYPTRTFCGIPIVTEQE